MTTRETRQQAIKKTTNLLHRCSANISSANMCVSMPLCIPDIYKKQRHRYGQARVMLRPDKRARAYVASANSTNFTVCDKRHGETGLHCVKEKARPCEAQMHMQALQMSQRGNATRSSALKWISITPTNVDEIRNSE